MTQPELSEGRRSLYLFSGFPALSLTALFAATPVSLLRIQVFNAALYKKSETFYTATSNPVTNSNPDDKYDFCRPVTSGGSGKEAGVSLSVRLAPRSSKNEVVGPHNRALKIKVKSPPVDGAANSALITYLSKLLKKPKTSITILSGHRSKEKRLKVDGVSVEEVKSALLKKET